MTFKEYDLAARKLISKYSRKYNLSNNIINNEDFVSSVIYGIMNADWKYNDGVGNKYGYRKSMAEFAIRRFLHNKNKNNDCFSIDNINI